MPTKRQITQIHLAAYRLHGGPPPGEQHEIKMLEDPAYRAAHQAGRKPPAQIPVEHRDASGAIISPDDIEDPALMYLLFDKKNRRIVQIPYGHMKSAIWDNGELVGVAEYNPRTGRETFIGFKPRKA